MQELVSTIPGMSPLPEVFSHHPECKDLGISCVCFADDLFIAFSGEQNIYRPLIKNVVGDSHNTFVDTSHMTTGYLKDYREYVCSSWAYLKLSKLWDEEILWLIAELCGKSCHSIIRNIARATMIYYIWQERNGGVFQENPRSSSSVLLKVRSDVKLKGCQFSNVKPNFP
ncbi:hypothetical protein RHSIM_Rhsim10G0214900 [Rhododendron simsii]|uniref:Reverse transcriptase domain-containing protein n=1 Tax=Rhododendron simsii TaxID=118357 RepID=A0A834LAY3_RHOSS|nr:hypothetical protein RHSIM_Rhsim10G0214900 [Rhododendron simsii]